MRGEGCSAPKGPGQSAPAWKPRKEREVAAVAVGPAGNGARQAGGASPVTTYPDKFRLGAVSPGRRWKGRRRQLGQSTHKGKKLLFWVGKGVRKVSRV